MAKSRPATLTSRAGTMVYTGKGAEIKPEDNPAELPVQTPRRIVRHPEFFFDNTLVAIQIEDTLFNVHKYQLTKSEVFSDMFKMPKPKNDEPEEGSSPEHPIVIEGVAASDFAALLKVLYASLFSSHQPSPEALLIIPAFRLANMFNFSELRAYLLPLAEKSLNDVDKIVFAKEFSIKQWLAPAYVRLCQREERLSIEEARKLDVDGVLMISHMREEYRRQGSVAIPNRYYCYDCLGMSTNQGSTLCSHCRSKTAYLYCTGPSLVGPKINTDNTIEAEVTKWVENN